MARRDCDGSLFPFIETADLCGGASDVFSVDDTDAETEFVVAFFGIDLLPEANDRGADDG